MLQMVYCILDVVSFNLKQSLALSSVSLHCVFSICRRNFNITGAFLRSHTLSCVPQYSKCKAPLQNALTLKFYPCPTAIRLSWQKMSFVKSMVTPSRRLH